MSYNSKQLTGLNRQLIDQFYTKEEVAKLCIDELIKKINLEKYTLIIEPSAGTGSFSNYFIEHKGKYKLKAYDIEPKQDYIEKIDFLVMNDKYQNENILVIGNPPFGRQSSLAKKFIQKCTSFCQTLAFILPKSFKKSSMQKVFPLTFHLIFELDLPLNSFYIEKSATQKSYDVPCIFQIWDHQSIHRYISPKLDPIGFSYVVFNDKPDFSLRRVGVNAGMISCDLNKSKESHYFIRLDDKYKNQSKWNEIFIEKYKQHQFKHNNTVGPKSISKQEFTEVLNIILTDFK